MGKRARIVKKTEKMNKEFIFLGGVLTGVLVCLVIMMEPVKMITIKEVCQVYQYELLKTIYGDDVVIEATRRNNRRDR